MGNRTQELLPYSYADSLDQFEQLLCDADPTVATYTNNHLVSHMSALEHSYPCVHALLGSESFAPLARVYAQHYPALASDINYYGAEFPKFLSVQTRSSHATMYDWLLVATIAYIEYAMVLAYYAQDGEELEAQWCDIHGLTPVSLMDISYLLQRFHPYADIECTSKSTGPVAVWRDGNRLQVTQSMSTRMHSGNERQNPFA